MSRFGAFIAFAGLLALAGCPTVDLGDTPENLGVCNPPGGETYFENQIWTNYMNVAGTIAPNHKCTDAGCHDLGGSVLRMTVDPPDYQANYTIVQAELNCSDPEASKFLTWPLAGIDAHGGGDIFNVGDPQYEVFEAWFAP